MSRLRVENVSKAYETPTEPLVVLRDVSLTLEPGDSCAIVGPSGTGKSTLLNVIGSLDSPTSGTVHLGDANPHAMSEDEVARFRNDNLGFIFQEHHLLPQLSVMENTLLPSLAQGQPDQAMIERARELLERVGLSERITHVPSELSGGERQRVAVARALLRGPTMLLADEPTGSLDRDTAETVGQLLIDLQKSDGMILVVVTHSMALAEIMDHRYELNQGALASL